MNIASRRLSAHLLRTIVIGSALVVTGAHLATAQDAEASAQTAPAVAAPQATRSRTSPTRNVRVAVTVTDQVGAGQPLVKTVSMVIADGHNNQIRSMTRVPREAISPPGGAMTLPGDALPLNFNVDAQAYVTGKELVLVELRFNYRTAIGSAGVRASAATVAADAQISEISEEMTLLVKPGTSVMAAESADATSDRKVKVEVRADILP